MKLDTVSDFRQSLIEYKLSPFLICPVDFFHRFRILSIIGGEEVRLLAKVELLVGLTPLY